MIIFKKKIKKKGKVIRNWIIRTIGYQNKLEISNKKKTNSLGIVNCKKTMYWMLINSLHIHLCSLVIKLREIKIIYQMHLFYHNKNSAIEVIHRNKM